MLAKRDGGWYCHYCHLPISRQPDSVLVFRNATVDHRVAKATGGREDDTSNMVLCCDVCNQRKGTMSYRAFRQRTAHLRRKRRRANTI
jgi:5-methylcytosine-specific restriction endonuclease McrA